MPDQDSDLKLEDFDEPAPEAGDGASEEAAAAAPPADIAPEDESISATELAPVFDVPVRISAVLGKSVIDVHDLLALDRGSVLELDRKIGEAIDIYVNNRIVARGEIVIVDEQLGITMTEIIKDNGNAG